MIMLDFLYTLFIAPLEFWMEKTLQWGFDHTQSWGWAIIVMSIVVNTVILPIYLKAEHWQEEERSIRKSFENDEAMIKRTFKGQERFAMITTMHRQAGYSPLLTLRSSIGFFLQIPFFFAAYHFLSHFEPLQGISFLGLTDLSKPDELFTIGGFAINVMPILMTIINIASALIYTQNLSKRDKYQLYGMAAIFLVLLYNAASGLVLYWTFNNIYSLAKNAVMHETKEFTLKFSVPKISSNFKFLHSFSDKLSFVKNWNLDSLQTVFWPASFLWLCLTFIYFPIKLYDSDPMAFEIPMGEIFSSMLGVCQIVIFVFFIIWFCCRKKLRSLISVLTLAYLISTILFAFVLEQELGVIVEFIFQKPHLLHNKSNIYFDITAIIFSLAFIFFIAKFNLAAYFKKFVILSLFSVFSFCIYTAFPYISKENNSSEIQTQQNIPDSAKQMLSFSKEGTNIVVLMLDAFTGGNMKQILEKDPTIFSDLDGFTWYTETMTSGGGTIVGMPSILGGEDLAADTLMDQSRTEALEETINKKWASFFNYLLNKNFEINLMEYNWINEKFLNQYLHGKINLIHSKTLWKEFPSIWAKTNNLNLKNYAVNYSRFFYSYGLFKVAPLSLQKKIYKNGRWGRSVSTGYHNQMISLQKYAELDSFSKYSSVIDSKKNQFKFIINETTHFPWSLSEKCLPIASKGTSELDENGINKLHLQTEYCAIKSVTHWIKWMKEKGIYDNSMLVIVSDHGDLDSEQIFNVWNKTPPKVGFHALLLVKPFNSKGTLKLSDHLTMNYDVRKFISQNLGDQTSSPWLNRQRVRNSVTVNFWQKDKHAPNYFIIKDYYKIRGSLMKKENWEFSKSFKPSTLSQ